MFFCGQMIQGSGYEMNLRSQTHLTTCKGENGIVPVNYVGACESHVRSCIFDEVEEE